MLKHLNKTDKGTAEIDIMPAADWIDHYKQSWYDAAVKEGNDTEEPAEVDSIEMS